MLRSLARVASSIDWTSPQVRDMAVSVYQSITGQDPAAIRRDSLERRVEILERLTGGLTRVAGLSGAAPVATMAPDVVGATPSLDAVIERLRVAGQQADEALRFAREDGLTHPEAVRRLMQAQELVTTTEREILRPEVLAALPPGERAWADTILPELRRARQALHSDQQGGPATIDSLTAAAASLGRLQTQLRVARAAGWRPPVGTPRAPASSSQGAVYSVYSRYAPDMRVDTGCLPCGRAHLSGAVGMVRNLGRLAQQRGMADPDVQSHIQMASEEIEGLWQDDWTPEKIAASPPEEQAILERIVPRLRAVHEHLEAARTPSELQQVVDELASVNEEFVRMDQGRSTRSDTAAMIVATEPAMDHSHRILPPSWLYEPPSTETVMEATAPPDSAVAFDNLVRALGDRGVRVRWRNLQATPEGVLEGQYVFGTNTILLGAATLARDPYAVQVLAHEAAHALADNPACHTYNEEVPYRERPEERLAQSASLIAMLEDGLPVELQDGSELAPGDRRVDWDGLRAAMAPDDYARLLWTSAWIADAMDGAPRDYRAVSCPPTSLPAAVTLRELRA